MNLSTDGDEGGYDFELDLQTMNKLLESEIDRTLDTVRSALSKAHLTKRDIDHVVLVGGSSRLLLVQEKITSFFGKSKMTQATNCDECVAKGACLSLVNHYRNNEILIRNSCSSIPLLDDYVIDVDKNDYLTYVNK